MLNKFLDYLLIKKGFGKITIENYRRVLNKFLRETSESPTVEQVEQYIAEIIKRGCSYSHIINTSVTLERFMEFIGKSVKIARPRKPSVLVAKEILTEGEVARILAVTKNNRENAIFSILIYGGLRNMELCNLRVRDIDYDNSLIKVFGGKFKKDRIVPITKECVKIIENYLRDFPREDNKWLFSTFAEEKQYTGWALRKMIKVITGRTKIKKRVYPHLLRHTLATHLLNKGMNIVAVQKILGHTRIETTMLYIHLSPQKIKQEYQYYVPNYN